MKLYSRNVLAFLSLALLVIVGCTSSSINDDVPVNSSDLVDQNIVYKSKTVKVDVVAAPKHSLDKKAEEIVTSDEIKVVEEKVGVVSTEVVVTEEKLPVIKAPIAKEDTVVDFVEEAYVAKVMPVDPSFDDAVRDAEERRGILPRPVVRIIPEVKVIEAKENISIVDVKVASPIRKFEIKDVPVQNVTFLSTIVYHSNTKADISDKDMKALKSVADFAKKNNGTVRVVGNSSSRSKDMKEIQNKFGNFELSLLRAEKVRDALIRQGVSKNKVFIDAVSDTEKILQESMPLHEAVNRRTEIYISY